MSAPVKNDKPTVRSRTWNWVGRTWDRAAVFWIGRDPRWIHSVDWRSGGTESGFHVPARMCPRKCMHEAARGELVTRASFWGQARIRVHYVFDTETCTICGARLIGQCERCGAQVVEPVRDRCRSCGLPQPWSPERLPSIQSGRSRRWGPTDSNDPALLVREVPGGGALFVIDGNITSIAVDGVVSNDDVDGRMYTVIASSIKAAAGPDVERQSIAQGPFRRGDAWHTDAGTLSSPIRLVIHIAAMDRRGDTDPGTIERCVISALEEARAQELDSIALAAFGTGPRGSGPKVIEMHQWLTDVSKAIVRQFVTWRREGKATGKNDLKVLIVLYGEDLDTAVETLCNATYGDIPPATTPLAWPGTARVLDVTELSKDIIGRDARLIAIDGPRASGKSMLAAELKGQWTDAVVIEMEEFYWPSRERPSSAAPTGSYDYERLVKEVIEPLRAGNTVRYQQYNRARDELGEWCEVPAGTVVLVVGLFSSSAVLRKYFDYKIWVDCPYDVRLARAVKRDGGTREAVKPRDWVPAEVGYVAEQCPIAHADVVLDGQGTDAVAFRVVRGLKKSS